METSATARGGGGIWTEHHDAQGRTFYFNMAVGRSFWDLPAELKALVKRPASEGDAVATGGTTATAAEAAAADNLAAVDEETRRRREQVLLQQQQAVTMAASGGNGRAALHERMAAAAQKQSELRRMAGDKQQQQQQREESAPPDASHEYLEMVRQLEHVDRQTEGSGSKWLVR